MRTCAPRQGDDAAANRLFHHKRGTHSNNDDDDGVGEKETERDRETRGSAWQKVAARATKSGATGGKGGSAPHTPQEMQYPREKQQQQSTCAPEVSGFFDVTTLKTVAVSGPDTAPPAIKSAACPQAPSDGDPVPLRDGADAAALSPGVAPAVTVAAHETPIQGDTATPSAYDIFARLRVWSAAGASAERSLIIEGEEAHDDESSARAGTAESTDPSAAPCDSPVGAANVATHTTAPGAPGDSVAAPTDDLPGGGSAEPTPDGSPSAPASDADGGGDAAAATHGDDQGDCIRHDSADATLWSHVPGAVKEQAPASVPPDDVDDRLLQGTAHSADDIAVDSCQDTAHAPTHRGNDAAKNLTVPPTDADAAPEPPDTDIPVHASSLVAPVACAIQPTIAPPPPPLRRWGPVAEAGWTATALDALDVHVARILTDKTPQAHVVVFAHGAAQSVPASVQRFGADAVLWAVSSAPAARALDRHGCAVVKWPARAAHAAETASLSDLVTAVPWGRVNMVIDIGAERSRALRARTLTALLPRLARGAIYACGTDCHQAALELERSGIAKAVHRHMDVIAVETPDC